MSEKGGCKTGALIYAGNNRITTVVLQCHHVLGSNKCPNCSGERVFTTLDYLETATGGRKLFKFVGDAPYAVKIRQGATRHHEKYVRIVLESGLVMVITPCEHPTLDAAGLDMGWDWQSEVIEYLDKQPVGTRMSKSRNMAPKKKTKPGKLYQCSAKATQMIRKILIGAGYKYWHKNRSGAWSYKVPDTHHPVLFEEFRVQGIKIVEWLNRRRVQTEVKMPLLSDENPPSTASSNPLSRTNLVRESNLPVTYTT